VTKSQATVHTLSYDDIFDQAMIKWKNGDRKAFMDSEIIEYIHSRVGQVIERGDLVDVPNPEQDAPAIRWVWSGDRYIAFTTDIPDDSDYDAIPEEFKVISEFPIHFWSKTNLGGTCCGCDDVNFDYTPFIDEICDNLSIRLLKNGKSAVSSFFHSGEQLYLVDFDTSISSIIDSEKFNAAQLSHDLYNVLIGSSQKTISFSAKPCDDMYTYEGQKNLISSNTLFAHLYG